MDKDVFKNLDVNKNNKLSTFNNDNIEILLKNILSYKLEYRDIINLEKTSSFGLEIEFKNLNRNINLNYKLVDFNKWNLEKEFFLYGYELISPILFDSEKNWTNLEIICKLIKKYGEINSDCGAHIHIGTQVIGNKEESWLNFIILWSIFEPVILKFTDGEYSFHRPDMDEYATIVREKFLYLYEIYEKNDGFSIDKFIRDAFCNHKTTAINFNNVAKDKCYKKGNTIEFRTPNGTLNPIIWQNNVNLLVKLLERCQKNDFDKEYLNYLYLKERKAYYNYNDYSKFYINLALDFVDIVFDNNLDKVYFLRQYLKDYPESSLDYKNVKKFTK